MRLLTLSTVIFCFSKIQYVQTFLIKYQKIQTNFFENSRYPSRFQSSMLVPTKPVSRILYITNCSFPFRLINDMPKFWKPFLSCRNVSNLRSSSQTIRTTFGVNLELGGGTSKIVVEPDINNFSRSDLGTWKGECLDRKRNF